MPIEVAKRGRDTKRERERERERVKGKERANVEGIIMQMRKERKEEDNTREKERG